MSHWLRLVSRFTSEFDPETFFSVDHKGSQNGLERQQSEEAKQQEIFNSKFRVGKKPTSQGTTARGS